MSPLAALRARARCTGDVWELAPGKRLLRHSDPFWHRRLLYPCTVIKLEPVASDLVQLICGMDSVAFCSRCAAHRSRVAALTPLVLCSKSWAAISPHRPPHPHPHLPSFDMNCYLEMQRVVIQWNFNPVFPSPQSDRSNETKVEPGLFFIRGPCTVSSLALHVRPYYGLWRLSVGCLKKKKRDTHISLIFFFFFSV